MAMSQLVPRTIYLIRHAQSEENVLALQSRISSRDFNAVLRRSPEAQLTPEGQLQAQALLAKLADVRIEHLYSSPFTRALTTANVLGNAYGLQPEIVDSLQEVLPRQRDEGRSSHSLGSMFLRSYFEMLWPWGEGENWATAYQRAQAAWGIVSNAPAETVAVVSHRALLSLILMSLRRSPIWRVCTRDVANGGISVIERVAMMPDA